MAGKKRAKPTTRDLVRAVRRAEANLRRCRKLSAEMSGNPDHPAWVPILEARPKEWTVEGWANSCYPWVIAGARRELDRARETLLRHVMRTERA